MILIVESLLKDFLIETRELCLENIGMLRIIQNAAVYKSSLSAPSYALTLDTNVPEEHHVQKTSLVRYIAKKINTDTERSEKIINTYTSIVSKALQEKEEYTIFSIGTIKRIAGFSYLESHSHLLPVLPRPIFRRVDNNDASRLPGNLHSNSPLTIAPKNQKSIIESTQLRNDVQPQFAAIPIKKVIKKTIPVNNIQPKILPHVPEIKPQKRGTIYMEEYPKIVYILLIAVFFILLSLLALYLLKYAKIDGFLGSLY